MTCYALIIYSGMSKQFAMSIGGAEELDETSWELFAKECGIKPKALYKYYTEIKTAVNEAAEESSGFPYDGIKAVSKKYLEC